MTKSSTQKEPVQDKSCQNDKPKQFDKSIVPYGIALVEFEDERIQIAGIITDTDLKSLDLGMKMETTAIRMFSNEEKQDVVSWAFQAVK